MSNIEERLFNEIIALRKEKQEIFEQLNVEIQRNNDLERDYVRLQRDYAKVVEELNRTKHSYNR